MTTHAKEPGATPENNGACQTPIEDLLAHVPRDLRVIVEGKEPYPSSHHIPVGYHCEDAMNVIKQLRRENAALVAEQDELKCKLSCISEAHLIGAMGDIVRWANKAIREAVESATPQTITHTLRAIEQLASRKYNYSSMTLIHTNELTALRSANAEMRDSLKALVHEVDMTKRGKISVGSNVLLGARSALARCYVGKTP
jgi:hypothetical protein